MAVDEAATGDNPSAAGVPSIPWVSRLARDVRTQALARPALAAATIILATGGVWIFGSSVRRLLP